jgi:heptaprenyl diphosphate synthase
MTKTKKIALCAVLIALALALSYVERFIPLQLLIPLPGVKLGLANIVTLIALYLLGGKSAFAILIPRCVLGAVFGGGITGLMFSLTGGLLAMSVMALSRKAPLFSIYGVSVLGAAAHSVGQIMAAMVLMHSVYVGAYLPYLLGVSIFTGLATGTAGAGVLRVLRNRI